MTEESERMLTLLQEVAVLKNAGKGGTRVDAVVRRKRRKQIGKEMKQLATQKKQEK